MEPNISNNLIEDILVVANFVVITNIIEVDDTGVHYCNHCISAASIHNPIPHKPGCVVDTAQTLITQLTK